MGKRKNSDFLPDVVEGVYQTVYDSVEFALATGQTDYNVATNQSTSFVNAPYTRSIVIRTDQEITVKFNSSDSKAITISRREGSLTITRDMGLEITNIFITNASGSTANIKLFQVP